MYTCHIPSKARTARGSLPNAPNNSEKQVLCVHATEQQTGTGAKELVSHS